MKQHLKEKTIGAFAISGILAVLLVVFLTIAGDLYAPLKDGLKNTFGHHWVGKGILSFVGFFVLGFLFYKIGIGRKNTDFLVSILVWVTFFSVLALVGFHVYEAFLVAH